MGMAENQLCDLVSTTQPPGFLPWRSQRALICGVAARTDLHNLNHEAE